MVTFFRFLGVSALGLVANSAIANASLELEVHVDEVGHKLAVANARDCKNQSFRLGFTVVNSADYDSTQRSEFSSLRRLAASFLVVSVVPDSGADFAGVRPGDVIVEVNGVRMGGFKLEFIREKADFRRAQEFWKTLGLSKRAASEVVISRKGELIKLALQATAACDVRFVVDPEDEVNAWTDGVGIAVTRRLLGFTQDDNELAFVLAHEMAHSVLEHGNRLGGSASLVEKLGFGASDRRRAELEADVEAVTLMQRAGYNPTAAVQYIERLGRLNPFYIPTTHPSFGMRKNAIEKAIAER